MELAEPRSVRLPTDHPTTPHLTRIYDHITALC